MFKNNFVVSIKCNGSFLRDDDNTVNILFDKNYSIFLKNLDSRKAVVNVSIDGKDVLGGSSIIVNPSKPTELEGFMKGNEVKNKFKFIQKTKDISDYRGDNVDDGIVRVEYTFEKKVNSVRLNYNSNYYYHYNPVVQSSDGTDPYKKYEWYYDTTSVSSNEPPICNSSVNRSLGDISAYSCSNAIPLKDEGITVKGSEVSQVFNPGFVNELEECSNVITLMLRGYNSKGDNIKESIFTTTKLTCPTCGKSSRSNCKFCSRCGTYLL